MEMEFLFILAHEVYGAFLASRESAMMAPHDIKPAFITAQLANPRILRPAHCSYRLSHAVPVGVIAIST